MKKKILAIIASVVALCCTAFCGCQENNGSSVDNTGISNENVIKISESLINLSVGDSYELSVLVLPETSMVEWSSSSPSVVSVDENGKITALATGQAVITASIGEYEKSFCTINVEQMIIAAYSFTLKNNDLSLFVGEDYQLDYTVKYGSETLSNENIIWQSSNLAVATVTNTGKIQPLAYGESIIEATYYTSDNKKITKSCTVSVIEYVNLQLEEATQTVEVNPGETFTLTVHAFDPEGELVTVKAEDLLWSSMNDKIVTYKDGTYKAVACGETNVKVSYCGSEAFCRIKVKGISADLFETLRGGAGTGVTLGEDGMMTYTGTVGANNANSVAIKGETWKKVINDAKALGYTEILIHIYSLDGVCLLKPENTEYTFFKDAKKSALVNEDCSLEQPFTGKVSLAECESWPYMVLGMSGAGSFTFTVSFA